MSRPDSPHWIAAKAEGTNTPYSDLLPPLSTEEKAALKADIKANGVLNPVFLDEDGNVLDGRHRLEFDPKAPTKVIRGLTEGEKQAFVYRANFNRHNLSPSQKTEVRKRMKSTAKLLREEDPKKWTQTCLAKELGIGQQTVSDWFAKKNGSATGSGKTSKPNASVKVPPERRPEIAERIAAGENREQVAADFGITGRQIATIATKETKHRQQKQERQQRITRLNGDLLDVHLGDFRVAGDVVDDESVDLIFTDPPYDKEFIHLYGDLSKFAARVLRPGGWCLTYSGQSYLPDVYAALASHLTYGWTFAIHQTGGDTLIRKFKLRGKWKPVIGFYKPPLSVWWDGFPDIVSGGKEKMYHEWQQSESEASHFIESMSPAGGLVCDPMAGSGTSLVAARQLGRQWIGFELEQEHVDTARIRLNDTKGQ